MGVSVVPAVDLVEVDVVGAEAPQARVDLLEDRLAREAVAVGPGAHRAVDLRGEHDVLAPREGLERAADDLLARARTSRRSPCRRS